MSALEDLAQNNTLDEDYDQIKDAIMEEAEKIAKSKKETGKNTESWTKREKLSNLPVKKEPNRVHRAEQDNS